MKKFKKHNIGKYSISKRKREKERKVAYSLSGVDSVPSNAQQVRRETLK